MAHYAYIRVSTKEQNIDRQLVALEPFQIPKRNILCDYQSGKDFDRPAYKKLLKRLSSGDLLIVKSIDRLGRYYNDILVQWQYITKEVHADIKVLDMPLLDTRAKDGDLTGTLIADMVLQVLAYVAQTERDFIRQRQVEGIAAAKARGQRFGKLPMEIPSVFPELLTQWQAGQISVRKAALLLGVSHTTFHRWAKKTVKASKNSLSQEVDFTHHL